MGRKDIRFQKKGIRGDLTVADQSTISPVFFSILTFRPSSVKV
jgi:hypothetical protein